MKKINLTAVCFCLAIFFMVLSPLNSFAQVLEESDPIKYECVASVEVTSNGIFIKSTCNNNPGDCCNSPGSVHRVKVPTLNKL